jgi:malonyl-CoA decarboxylase
VRFPKQVEKVVHYESVHRIRTLSDLKNRLSASRRCFIYTHSTMPYEPLVILHIALTSTVTASIGDLIQDNASRNNASANSAHDGEKKEFTNAIFYSINSCQKGLQQVDLGNALIKSCVRLLLEEFPTLKQFHTLSPIPKFKEWLDAKISLNDFNCLRKCLTNKEVEFLAEHYNINESDDKSSFRSLLGKIHKVINSSEFRENSVKHQGDFGVDLNTKESDSEKHELIVANFLKRACAFHLAMEKKNGYAFNSVCNFHIKNGAQVYRVNYGAETGETSWNRSYGLMVNYGYVLEEIESNCVNYLANKTIKLSPAVQKMLDSFN